MNFKKFLDKAKEKTAELTEKAVVKTAEALEKAKPVAEKAQETAGALLNVAKEKAKAAFNTEAKKEDKTDKPDNSAGLINLVAPAIPKKPEGDVPGV